VEGNLHQKILFLITTTLARPLQRGSKCLPRQLTIQLGYQLKATPPRVVSAQSSMLQVSSWTMPPGLKSVLYSIDAVEERIKI
jgi:hypothetical protein